MWAQAVVPLTTAGWVAGESGELELRHPKTGAIMYDASGMKYTPESWAAEQARGGAAYLFVSVVGSAPCVG